VRIDIEWLADPKENYIRMLVMYCTEKELKEHMDKLNDAGISCCAYDFDNEKYQNEETWNKILLTSLGDFFVVFAKK